MRDPTQADPALRQALAGAQAAAVPAQRPLPQVLRRGLIVIANRPAEALIEVQERGAVPGPGSGVFLVHEGSTFTAGSSVLRVVRLTSDIMEIAVDSQNETIIVR
jgi:hypothetical protein